MTALLILVAVITVLIVLRVPVAFALLVPCFGYIVLDPSITLGVGLQRITANLDSFPLVAVPLFILVGYLANEAGIAGRLIDFSMRLIGRVRGSLGYVNVGTSVGFSWMSGAVLSDVAALGSILIPQMKKRGYAGGFAAALSASSALIGPLMPPSIAAIIYAVTASVSVGDMLMAGILPAVALALILCVVVFLYVRKHPEVREENVTRTGLGKATLSVLPIAGAPVVIIGGILGGVFTPTEAAGVAVAYLLGVAAVSRSISVPAFWNVLKATAGTTGQVMLIVSAGGLFAWILAREGAPQTIANAILDFTEDPRVFLLLTICVLLVVGIAIETVTALIVTVPVLLPVATQLGVDPLHLGIVMIFTLLLGNLTPPVALALSVASSVTDVSFNESIRASLRFYVPLLAALLVVTFIEDISLLIPQLAGSS